jgi:hypothetical protein
MDPFVVFALRVGYFVALMLTGVLIAIAIFGFGGGWYPSASLALLVAVVTTVQLGLSAVYEQMLSARRTELDLSAAAAQDVPLVGGIPSSDAPSASLATAGASAAGAV